MSSSSLAALILVSLACAIARPARAQGADTIQQLATAADLVAQARRERSASDMLEAVRLLDALPFAAPRELARDADPTRDVGIQLLDEAAEWAAGDPSWEAKLAAAQARPRSKARKPPGPCGPIQVVAAGGSASTEREFSPTSAAAFVLGNGDTDLNCAVRVAGSTSAVVRDDGPPGNCTLVWALERKASYAIDVSNEKGVIPNSFRICPSR
jgi:hypothetical protein